MGVRVSVGTGSGVAVANTVTVSAGVGVGTGVGDGVIVGSRVTVAVGMKKLLHRHSISKPVPTVASGPLTNRTNPPRAVVLKDVSAGWQRDARSRVAVARPPS